MNGYQDKTRRLFVIVLALACAMIVELGNASRADAMANTCGAASELGYPTASNFTAIGTTIHVVITVGAGSIQGGTMLTIRRLRFNLDCDNTDLGIDCPDDGEVISYHGNLTTTCPATFVADHNAGDVTPNQIVFNADPPVDIPRNTFPFCTLEFDTRVESRSNDGTPGVVEQTSGFDASLSDGYCNNVPPLAAGSTNAASFQLCPLCDDLDQCNGVETCDPQLGCQPGAPIVCNDNEVCTTDFCDPTLGCVHEPSCNQPPDCAGARPSLATLWPPNQQMFPVTIDGVTDPDGDPVTTVVTGITQDEPIGAGSPCPDGAGVGTGTAHLRAERDGHGDGRLYSVAFTAQDGNGGQCSGSVTVCVPHNREQGCTSGTPTVDSTACQ